MAYTYRHTAGPHSVSSVGHQLVIDGRAVVSPVPVLRPRISLTGRVAFKANEPGTLPDGTFVAGGAAVVVEPDDSMWVASDDTTGNAPVFWLPIGALAIQVDASGVLKTVSPSRVQSSLSIGRYASEGIARIEADGRVILGNERSHTAKHGRANCWNWDEDEQGNFVCLTDAGHPEFGCVGYWTAQDGWRMWIPPAHVQEAPTVSQGRVAISGHDTPEPDAIPWQPLVAPVIPPVVLEPWPANFPPIGVGCLSHTPVPSDPGNLGNVGTDKPVIIEGYRQSDGARWTRNDEDRKRQRLIYVDWKESHAREAMLANAKADQDAYGGTIVFYFDMGIVSDSHGDLTQLRAMKAEGRAVALGLNCYPRHGESDPVEAMAGHVSADIALFRHEFPSIVLFAAGYRQAWSSDDARRSLRRTARMAVDHQPFVKAVVITKRPPYMSDLTADIEAFCELAPETWNVDAAFPKWQRPVPVQPVTPSPAPPTPVKPVSWLVRWLRKFRRT